MNIDLLRTRWAAIGAAVAVTLGAGGIGIGYATSPAGAAAYVPVTPCRLVDTRPAPDTVGTKTSPLGPGEVFTVSAHGDNGQCTGPKAIPATATGLQLNVTGVGASTGTFLTVFPTGATQPTASSLNPVPNAAVPNAVTTGVSAGGQFDIYNAFGSVNVIVDVVGYYTDHDHDDRYYTKAQVDAAISAAVASAVATATAASSTTAYTATEPSGTGIVAFAAPAATQTDVVTVNLPAGSYLVTATTVANNNAASVTNVTCALWLGGTIIGSASTQVLSIGGAGGEREQIALTGAGTLASAGTAVLRCSATATNGSYLVPNIVAVDVGAVVAG